MDLKAKLLNAYLKADEAIWGGLGRLVKPDSKFPPITGEQRAREPELQARVNEWCAKMGVDHPPRVCISNEPFRGPHGLETRAIYKAGVHEIHVATTALGLPHQELEYTIAHEVGHAKDRPQLLKRKLTSDALMYSGVAAGLAASSAGVHLPAPVLAAFGAAGGLMPTMIRSRSETIRSETVADRHALLAGARPAHLSNPNDWYHKANKDLVDKINQAEAARPSQAAKPEAIKPESTKVEAVQKAMPVKAAASRQTPAIRFVTPTFKAALPEAPARTEQPAQRAAKRRSRSI